MRIPSVRVAAAACLPLLVAALLPAPAALADAGYHDFSAVESTLKQLAGQHRASAELIDMGSSEGGHPLYVLRVAGKGEVEPDQRPALFVGANIVGYHNAATEAALDLIQELLEGEGHEKLLSERTFYIAPALDPDAHDGMFMNPRRRLSGNAGRIDRDRDGLIAEDGPNDLDGNGMITRLRIRDPEGKMSPKPGEPREMIEAEAIEGQEGGWKVYVEGYDDDGDGAWNEDPVEGILPSLNFAHGFDSADVASGPWPSAAPESKALMDFLLAHRNVAAAVVYGPANHFLETPRGSGGETDTGTLKLEIPKGAAEFLGLDPEQKYTIDEIWEVAKDLPFVRQNNITKEQMLQFLGGGPATKPDDDDLKYLDKLADLYKERLKEAGLDAKRKAAQSKPGGLAPWLYYQYGAMALELDVWGAPKQEKAETEEKNDALSLDRLEEMSSEDFLALDDEKIAAFLEEIGAPPQVNAKMLRQRIESGQMTPKQMAQMAKRMGAKSESEEEKSEGPSDLLAFVDRHAPEAFVRWTKVTLPDGQEAEVGGFDPFIEVAPPYDILQPALDVHSATVLDLAEKMAQVAIVEHHVEDLGGGVYRLEVVAANRGFLPTHTKLAKRARNHLPVRLELIENSNVKLVTGARWFTSERLEGEGGSLRGHWLLHSKRPGADVEVEVVSDNAGRDRQSLKLQGE